METDTCEIIKAGAVHIDGDTTQEKISKLKEWLDGFIEEYEPDRYLLEDVQYQNNIKVYKVLAELLGVLENYYYENNRSYKVVHVGTWRNKYLGINKGKRDQLKQQTIDYVKEKYNIDVDSDTADAICIAEYGIKGET